MHQGKICIENHKKRQCYFLIEFEFKDIVKVEQQHKTTLLLRVVLYTKEIITLFKRGLGRQCTYPKKKPVMYFVYSKRSISFRDV